MRHAARVNNNKTRRRPRPREQAAGINDLGNAGHRQQAADDYSDGESSDDSATRGYSRRTVLEREASDTLQRWRREAMRPRNVAVGAAWLTGFVATSVWLEFGMAYVVVSLLVAMWRAGGDRSGSDRGDGGSAGLNSAYSVFNRGQQRLMGDAAPGTLERQLRTGGIS